jgi:hypothetical protein
LSPVRVHEHHKAIRFGERHRLQEHGIDHGKDRRVHADAERQRRHGSDGEARSPPQKPKRMPDVGQQNVHATSN